MADSVDAAEIHETDDQLEDHASLTTRQRLTDLGSDDDRAVFAFRQALIISAVLAFLGFAVDRVNPNALDRNVISTPFLWAIVVWIALVVISTFAFEQPRLRVVEGTPLLVGMAVGGAFFIVGLLTLSGGTVARRIVFLLANAIGVAIMWWGVASLVVLLIQWLRRGHDS